MGWVRWLSDWLSNLRLDYDSINLPFIFFRHHKGRHNFLKKMWWILSGDFRIRVDEIWYYTIPPTESHHKSDHYSRWWFQIFFIFTSIWGRFPFWLIFFRSGWNHQPVFLFQQLGVISLIPPPSALSAQRPTWTTSTWSWTHPNRARPASQVSRPSLPKLEVFQWAGREHCPRCRWRTWPMMCGTTGRHHHTGHPP